MENIKDILSSLNEIDFSDERKDIYNLEKLRDVNRRLIIEFEEYSESKVIFCLDVCEDINFSVFTGDNLQDILNLTNSLRGNVLYLLYLKHLVDKDDKLVEKSLPFC